MTNVFRRNPNSPHNLERARRGSSSRGFTATELKTSHLSARLNCFSNALRGEENVPEIELPIVEALEEKNHIVKGEIFCLVDHVFFPPVR